MLVGEPIDLSFLDAQSSDNAVSFTLSRISRMHGGNVCAYICLFMALLADSLCVGSETSADHWSSSEEN